LIIISPDVFNEIVEHARQHLPIECCGLLAGNDSTAVKVYRLTNTDSSAEHFSMEPKEQFTAVKDMRKTGLEMLAVYHSHPATPARMSQEDLRLAVTPGIRYIIVSLQEAEKPDIKSFLVENGQPIEEPILVQESH
jgi:proteasome lid subunit RPN8/RPN11